ncbi:hypothetical protein K443DRAFT_95159, partial [Laccaria amethystina LaAM-08-1]
YPTHYISCISKHHFRAGPRGGMFTTGMPFPVHGMGLGGQEFMALGAIGSLLSCKV